jgi:hypothetical protein
MQWILAKFVLCLLTDKKNQNCLMPSGGTSESPMLPCEGLESPMLPSEGLESPMLPCEGHNSLKQNLTFK